MAKRKKVAGTKPPEDGTRLIGYARVSTEDRVGAQRGYGFQWLGVSAEMKRQQPMWKKANAI